MEKHDFKKTEKQLYAPKATPSFIQVPAMTFLMVDGRGDPNTSASYSDALALLYSLSYAIKMSKMGGETPAGYFDFVVPPLEGFWQIDGENGFRFGQKDRFVWTSLIRQPDFVTPAVLAWAKEKAAQKNPGLDFSRVRLEYFEEGLCVQCMHLGPYDDEPATVAAMQEYTTKNGHVEDFSDIRRHHEIYLSDPRKCAPEKNRTIIRHPVKKI